MTDTNEPSSVTGGGKTRRLELVPAENLPTFYANSIQIMTSLYDISLTFGLSEPSVEDTALLKPVARIAMSPQLAKAIAILLTNKLQDYEREFGPLPDVSTALI